MVASGRAWLALVMHADRYGTACPETSKGLRDEIGIGIEKIVMLEWSGQRPKLGYSVEKWTIGSTVPSQN